jgi:hypothetical protein
MRVSEAYWFVAGGLLVGLASALGGVAVWGAAPVVASNPWQTWDISPASRAYPYALAHYLLAGRFPPATGQMREYTAHRSNDGGVLASACTYVLAATKPPAQWWSVAALSGGSIVSSAAAIQSAQSAVTEADGSLRITISRQPAPGNWLEAPQAGSFSLLYTEAESSASFHAAGAPVFTITRSNC